MIDHAAYVGGLSADGIDVRVVGSGSGKAIAFLRNSPDLTAANIRII